VVVGTMGITAIVGQEKRKPIQFLSWTPRPRSKEGTHPTHSSRERNMITPMRSGIVTTYISSPTVMKGQFLSGNKILKKAKAASRKATGIHNRVDRVIPNLKRCRRGAGNFVNGKGKSSERLWTLDASNPSKQKQSRYGCEIKSKSQSPHT
jgi:hypothetical protein